MADKTTSLQLHSAIMAQILSTVFPYFANILGNVNDNLSVYELVNLVSCTYLSIISGHGVYPEWDVSCSSTQSEIVWFTEVGGGSSIHIWLIQLCCAEWILEKNLNSNSELEHSAGKVPLLHNKIQKHDVTIYKLHKNWLFRLIRMNTDLKVVPTCKCWWKLILSQIVTSSQAR